MAAAASPSSSSNHSPTATEAVGAVIMSRDNNECSHSKEVEELGSSDDGMNHSSDEPTTTIEEEPESTRLSYEKTKSSAAYVLAKEQLLAGNFEAALSTVEEALTAMIVEDELHEALAPLYYLYGTTLLYSVEETEHAEEKCLGGEEDDDLQIAWENLESAKSILRRLDRQTLDLAQVHLRLGDLQRANGNYADALLDYEQTLTLLGDDMYDRKVADTRYSLGITCLLLSSEMEKTTNDDNDDARSQIAEHRLQSIVHYLECGRSIAGCIGNLCGKNAHEVAAIALEETDRGEKKGKAKATVEEERTLAAVALASNTLQTLRNRVSFLQAADSKDSDTVADMKQMLDELQETIDSSEEDRAGLQDVSAMRAMIEKDLEAAIARESDPSHTTTTVVGFGHSSGAVATSTNTNEGVHTMIGKRKKKRDSTEKDGNGSGVVESHSQDVVKRSRIE